MQRIALIDGSSSPFALPTTYYENKTVSKKSASFQDLKQAIEANDIKNGVDPNKREGEDSFLLLACAKGSADIVRALLEKGAEVDFQG